MPRIYEVFLVCKPYPANNKPITICDQLRGYDKTLATKANNEEINVANAITLLAVFEQVNAMGVVPVLASVFALHPESVDQ
jgi:hypothetical protein